MNNMNIGLWFDKILLNEYLSLDDKIKASRKELKKWEVAQIKKNMERQWSQYEIIVENQLLPLNTIIDIPFEITTLNPGLVCGIGYGHEIGYENEFKHGFSFDYTTGLPYIPGSSIKGTLRNAFKIADYLFTIIDSIAVESLKSKVSKKMVELIKLNKSQIDWKRIELAIFEGREYVTGEKKPSTKKDIFFDSFISKVKDNGEFLYDDYITSHRQEDGSYSPLKEPNPVRFIKVKPDVTFKFQFRLDNDVLCDNIIMTGEIKREIFKMILLDIGIGAKTNVGYGQFI